MPSPALNNIFRRVQLSADAQGSLFPAVTNLHIWDETQTCKNSKSLRAIRVWKILRVYIGNINPSLDQAPLDIPKSAVSSWLDPSSGAPLQRQNLTLPIAFAHATKGQAKTHSPPS